ncbi:hypothetical protein CTEN210_00015 [Chaetoceros tenuissimus]|uniref:ATP-dependent DNA helicase n=1 Tax=Chaetoceros tenuissimus TaxID=426638 RepID=A0AAD3CCL8_9STRA|nr:hypothetical protein CTEN210_00015 [Chaetoceros tenuissimus]
MKNIASHYKSVSKAKRKKRVRESTCQHHEIVDFCGSQHVQQILQFRKKKVGRKPTLFFEKVYELYLNYATYGEVKYFLNGKIDPLMQSTWRDSKNKLDEMMEAFIDLQAEEDHPQLSISDETRDLFFQSSRSRQHEILQMIAFEARNLSIDQHKCSVCKGAFISNKFNGGETKKCSDCRKNNRDKEKCFRMFPVWYDDDEIKEDKYKEAHYELPEELRDLTVTEKMLIQTQSFLIPCIHIGKGKFGLCGHTVMFKRDIASICLQLPRSELDYIEIKRLSVNKDQQTFDTFKVRRKKVIAALNWLKKHNRFYRDITIVEENLNWMGDKEEAQFTNFKENHTLSEKYSNCSVAKKQTVNPLEEKTMEMCGVASDRADSLFSVESKQVIDELAEATAKKTTPSTIMWPETDENPVDEYTEEDCFAKCYPWLFPGGYGDISHEVKSERSKAIEWTKLLLLWEDGRFQHDPCFTFHAFNFIQRHVNNGSSLTLLKSMFSENKTVDDIKEEIENGNFSTVGKIQNFAAQKIRGSDGWWRSRKHELDSWVAYHLDKGHGPPTLFMTFSCAEYWWNDLLHFLKKKIMNTEDEHLLQSLEEGDEESQRKIQAKLVDKYTASVQVFFQEKLDNWLETIGKNIFNIKHYYLRFEFAKGRGQIHAHMVAITADHELLTEFYHTFCIERKEELGAELMEEYVTNVLSLTEEIDFDKEKLESEQQKLRETSESSDSSSPLSTNFFSASNHKLDMCQLCYDVHMHECSDYCLGPQTTNGTARTCRMGAGKEVIPNDHTSTPGFESPKETASIEKDYKKDIHILKLKRNNSRLKKTSTSMLESWRANCDVSVIVYATDPNNIVPADIARINGYITSYCTKGNLSFQEERNSIAAIISTYENCGVRSERMNMNAMLRKSMNSLLTSRIVSKPEASVELMGCDLYWCTESAKHINLTGLQKLMKEKKKMTDPIQKYKFRHDTQKNLTFVEYMKILDKGNDLNNNNNMRLKRIDPKTKQRYLHPIGFNSSPIFPPTNHYAIATLVLHKKWDNRNRLDFELKKKTPIDEFYQFLESDDCPQSVKLQYCIAKHKFERKLYRSAPQEAHNKDIGELNEESTNLYNLVSHARFDHSKLSDFYKGDDGYDFNEIHHDFDPDNKSGPTWLDDTIDAMALQQSSEKKKYINSSTNKPYVISDIGDNEEQKEITFKVLQKIKEWMEFPEVQAQEPSRKFEPLILTVRGAGGTGKSFLVKVIVNAIESIFDVKVSESCAPTGCAAYNIFGKTIHSLFCIDIDDPTKELSQYKKEKLFQLLRNVLLLVIDERSMLSLELLNAISRNCSEFAHGTGNTEEIFGGIPVILILGDDSQLPPVKKLGAFDLFSKTGFKNDAMTGSDLKGAQILESTVQQVKSLRQVKRIVPNQEMLQEINETLRTKSGLTKDQSMAICRLNLDNEDITKERRLQIKDKALFVYTTKEEVFTHNEQELREIVDKTNPLMEFPYQLHKTPKSKLDKPIKSHFKLTTLIEAKTVLTRGARVSLTTNKCPLQGLFNGSLGTVIDIRFAKGESPLTGNLPLFVIVDFDNYCGPPWDNRYPTYVPVPIQTLLENRSKCNLRCCEMKYVPLEIAFARTLHKVQGQSIGEGHPVTIMVFNPGKTAFEGNNPGLLYTGISRATSMGTNDVNNSAIYFNYESKFKLYTRIREIHHKRKSVKRKLDNENANEFVEPQLTNEIYTKVKKRLFWTMFLDQKESLTNLNTTDDERTNILQWLNQKQANVTCQENLYQIVRNHSKRYKAN